MIVKLNFLIGLERPDGSENEGQMLEFGAVTFSFVKKKS